MIFQMILSVFSLIFIIDKTVAYDAIIEQALQLQHPLVVKAFDQEKEFRNRTIEDIQSATKVITETVSSLNEDQIEDLKKCCLERLGRDEGYILLLNNFIAENTSKLGFNVRSHKIKECLDGAKTLLSESFDNLVYGTPLNGYDIFQDSCPILQWNDTGIWGNSKGTHLKTAQYLLLKELGQTSCLNIPLSPSYYAAPLLMDASQLEGFSFFYENNTLLFPHSGYAFGGHRFDINHPHGKKYGPEDCSSWMSKMYGAPSNIGFSTADSLCAYRKTRGLGDFVPPAWPLSSDGKYLTEHFVGVSINEPQDFKLGMGYVHRRFPSTDPTMSTTLGTSGHTALVIGIENNSIITIGYNRDMPAIEGFGLQAFPFETYPKLIFSLNPVL